MEKKIHLMVLLSIVMVLGACSKKDSKKESADNSPRDEIIETTGAGSSDDNSSNDGNLDGGADADERNDDGDQGQGGAGSSPQQAPGDRGDGPCDDANVDVPSITHVPYSAVSVDLGDQISARVDGDVLFIKDIGGSAKVRFSSIVAEAGKKVVVDLSGGSAYCFASVTAATGSIEINTNGASYTTLSEVGAVNFR